MPEFGLLGHVKPFVLETGTKKSLHFSMGETQSRMDVLHPHRLDVGYTRTMMGFLLFHPEPREIAMIGLGGGSLAKFCHRYLPRARIHVVEINPHVIALRNEFQVPAESKRFTVSRGDGAEFVRAPPRQFDVLLVDGYDSTGLPKRLSSRGFYDDCHSALSADGVMVANLHLDHPRDVRQIDRIRKTFGDAVLVIMDVGGNSIVFADKRGAIDSLGGISPIRPR